jgi:hypothetical protein
MNIRNESASAMAKSAQKTAQKTKSGAITSAIKPNNQTKAKQYYNDLAKKNKEKNQKIWDRNHGNASEAAKIAKNTNALGTKVKTHKTGSQKYTASGQLEKVANRAGAYGEMKKTYSSGKSLYEAAYDSRRGKEGVTKEQADAISKSFKAMSAKERKQFFKDMYGKSLKEADKKIDERNDTRVVARDATSEDYLRLQNALRTGGGKGETTVAALGKDRAKNFAALTAQDFQKNKASKAAMGAIEGLSYAPTTNQFNSVYTEQEKNAIEEGKKSGAYMAGYMGGQFAQYGMGGVGSLGRSLTSSALKNAPKTTGKKILANVAGDTAVSAPLDAIDAAKQATDKNGNINAKEFAKYMRENTILFGGGGGALLEGASAGLTKLAGKKLINLQAKANAGTITAKETEALNRLYRNMFTTKADKYSSGSAIADQSLTKAVDKRLGVDGVSPDDVPKLMTGKDVADMADLRLKAVQRGLTPDESKHLGELTTKYNVQRVQYENNLKAVVEDSRVNIGKASASDVSRLRRAENYYKSIGATQDAREARLLTEKAEKNFADNVDRVTRAASEISGKLGREFKIDSADEIAEAFAKAGGQVDDVSQIHGYAQFDKDGNIVEYHVNKDSEQAMEFTFGHEFTHGFESLGKQYDDFKESLIKFVGDEWDEELESVKRQYQNVKNADFEKEAVANLVGRHLFAEDGRYLKHLLKEEPTLFEKIYNMIKKLLRGTSEKDRQLDALSKQLDDMLDSLSAETKSRITGAPDTTEMLFGGGKTLRDLIDSWHPNAEQANQLIRQRDMAMRKVKTAVKSGDYETIKKARIDAYEKYGWFQGYDGEWRFEIDDKDMSFVTGRLTFTKKSKLDKLAKEPKSVAMDELSKMVDGDDKLAQFIEHKELFKWYPELAELKVEIGSPREYRDLEPGEVFNSGEYNYAIDKLVLNPYLFAKDSNYAKSLGKGERSMDVRSTILHEIQHAIQLREDFAKGSSPDMFPTGVSAYEDAAGNIRAELIDRTPKVYDRDIADMVDRIDEKTEAIDRLWDIDGTEADHFESTFAEFIDLYDFSDDLSKAENIDNAMNFITKQAEDPVKPVNADFEARMRDAIGAEYETYKLAESNPYKAYNQTAGEVESRLVEERFNSQNRKHEYPIKEGQNIRYSEAVNTETAKFPNRTTLNESGLSEPFGKPPAGKVEASYGTANLKGAKDGKLLDNKGKVYPEAESAYKQAHEDGDTQMAQQMVDAVLAERGYTIDAYHGSDAFGFTEFDLDKMGDGASIFASNSTDVAGSYIRTGDASVKPISSAQGENSDKAKAIHEKVDDLIYGFDEYTDDDTGEIITGGRKTCQVLAQWLRKGVPSDNREVELVFGDLYNCIEYSCKLSGMPEYEARDIAYGGNREMKRYYDRFLENGVSPRDAAERFEHFLGDLNDDMHEAIDYYFGQAGGGIYHGKLKMENPFVVEANGASWHHIRIEEESSLSKAEEKEFDELDKTYVLIPPYEAEYIGNEIDDDIYNMDRLMSLYGVPEDELQKAFDLGYELNVKGGFQPPNRILLNLREEILHSDKYAFASAKNAEAIRQNAVNMLDESFGRLLDNAYILDIDDVSFHAIKTGGGSRLHKVRDDLIRYGELNKKRGQTITANTRQVSKMAKERGHDGVIFKDLVDYGGWVDDPRPENIYIVFNSNQFKSADPFTYRDDGSLIPLNERGTEAEPDIRLSTGQNKDGRTRTATSEDDYLNSLARDASADEAELSGIARASDNLEQEAPVKGAMSDTERAQIKAQKLGNTELTDAQVDTLADAQVALSNINGVRVPESLRKSTIKSIEEGYGVQASMLKLRKSEKSGKGETFTTVEDAYKSLSNDYPDLFPKDITNVDDQFARMMEVSTLKGGAKRYKYKYVVPKNRKFNQNDYAKKTAEPKKAEPKKAEAPKAEKPQKAKATKVETPKVETPKAEAPKPKKEKAKKPAKEEPKETPLPKSEKPPKKPKNKAEEHKAEAPTIEETLENAKKGYITDKELGEHGKRLKKSWRAEVTYIDSAFPEAAKAGEFGGKRIRAEEYNEALSKAQANVKENLGKVYDKVMNRDDYIVETVTSAAEKHALLKELTIRAGTGDKNAVLMQMKAIDKFDAGASLGGNMLQLQSYILRDSPQGRLRFMMRQIRRLNKEYEAQLKGKKLALTEDQAEKILNTKDELESAKLMEEIGKELWKDIPSGRIEAMNQIRHWSMLFNPKTHARNLGGNAVFKGAREISDELEIAMTKLAKKTGKGKKLFAENEPIMGARVSEKEKKQCKDILNKRFELDYTVGEQRADRFAEGNRTAGYLNERTDSKVKNAVAKTMNKLIDVNYELLDREDKLFFRPAYRKEYIRYCKAKGFTEKINGKNVVTAKSLENMTDAQMKEATAWAMQKAKIATFRDDSAISKRLIQWKQATESAGKTPLGKAGFRTLNVGMEAVLPFVKTPVNILRRGMDYSPVGLIRGVINGAITKDADVFMQSIHNLSTGLTGTGVFVLGWWAASHDWVTVNAGDISGDAYYDRDMGYQDYSVIPTRIIRDKFHVDVVGNDYSASMDWLAPMQFAFFQGAAVYSDKAINEGWSTEKMLSVLEASVSPMMEMSFMSTAKDTAESFFERAYRDGAGGEASFAEAAGRTLFGTMPQGWIGSFVPQLMNQSAGFSDKYMRDTSSTKKNEIVKSWDSWFKQMQNRIPGFRQSLNPKLNRKSEKVESVGDNTLTKLFNSFANPSNVKKITFDKYDNELIKIHNKMEDGKDKNTFFMNFTGNPSYDIKGEHLGKGEKDRRMSYNEKYDYMREKRKTQWDDIKKMVDAKSYGDMTWKMKADEVKDYHYISTVKADKKVYKDAYTAKKLADNNEDQRELYNKVKTYGGSAKDYVDSYIAIESLQARSHASINDYHMKALAIEAMPKNAQKKDLLSKAYGVWGDKITPAKKFVKQVGSASKALKEYSDAFCSGAGYCDNNEVSTSKRNMSVGLANYDVKERTYRAMGHDWQSAQSGAGLKKYGYSYKALDKMEADAMLKYDADHNNSLKKAELKAYVDSLGLDNDDEKACIFEYLGSGGSKNPYGTIYDHLEWGTEPDNEGGGGYGYGHRRGYRRHGRRGHGGHGGGGGSKGKMPSTDTGAFKGSVSNPFSTSNGSSASNLNDAYRKKARKLMRENQKK